MSFAQFEIDRNISVHILSFRRRRKRLSEKETAKEGEEKKKEWDIQINYNLNQPAFLYLLWISKMLIILVSSLVSRSLSFARSRYICGTLFPREFCVQFSHTLEIGGRPFAWASGMGLFWRKLFDYSCLHFVFFSFFKRFFMSIFRLAGIVKSFNKCKDTTKYEVDWKKSLARKTEELENLK